MQFAILVTCASNINNAGERTTESVGEREERREGEGGRAPVSAAAAGSWQFNVTSTLTADK